MRCEAIQIGSGGAAIQTYLLDNFPQIEKNRRRPVVIICPGGGYEFVSDRESEPVALRFAALGFHTCVLRYSVAPAVYPAALLELSETVGLFRRRAEEWNIDPRKIFVMGFSAGGHLAASLGVLWDDEALFGEDEAIKHRPDGLVLCYPVITSGEFAHRSSFALLTGDETGRSPLWKALSLERRVTDKTPPCFLWHTQDDPAVPVENSLLFASKLRAHGVPFELHVYPSGVHGLSLANEETFSPGRPELINPVCGDWPEMAARWMKRL